MTCVDNHGRLNTNKIALSRRKQGFDSPRARQRFQWVSNTQSQNSAFVQKIYAKVLLRALADTAVNSGSNHRHRA